MGYWYNVNLGTDNITVSSRVRLARNISNLPFPSKMSKQEREKLNSVVKDALLPSEISEKYNLKYIRMSDVPENERFAMMERHTVSREFIDKSETSAIVLSDDERVSIMIGEEDHIRIQVISSGKEFENIYNIANEIDEYLCSKLDIAFSDRFGFLTECPTNVGTGMRISAMMHLPLLEGFGRIPILQEWINKSGFTIRGTYGEGSKVYSSLYQVSNQITLGSSEKDILSSLKTIVERLTKQENDLRANLDIKKLEDDCFRSLYLLKGARIISSNEMMTLLSKVMIGINRGLIGENAANPISILINCQPYMLISKYGVSEVSERDEIRGKYLRENINI
ncbi:MAG: ATP--guanido phosphotransferase [Clostridia bacterium]|nr:ATP--guanido phosphotransferase [Clostridia bacterium]